MRKGRKIAVCIRCGTELKGTIPIDIDIICFFCNFPPEDDDDDDNRILRSITVRKGSPSDE